MDNNYAAECSQLYYKEPYMKKLLIVIAIFMSSCMVPYNTTDYTPQRNYYPYTHYQPTRVIVVKQKPHKHHKRHRRHIKVRINKHLKTK
jgi:hypothetical protein